MAKKNKAKKKDKIVDVQLAEEINSTPKDERADKTAQKAYDAVVKARKAVRKFGKLLRAEGEDVPTAFALSDGALGRVEATVKLVAQKEGIELVTAPKVNPMEMAFDEQWGVDAPKV